MIIIIIVMPSLLRALLFVRAFSCLSMIINFDLTLITDLN